MKTSLQPSYSLLLEVVAEDVSNEGTLLGRRRVQSPEEKIEEVVGSPEVEGLGELKKQRRYVGLFLKISICPDWIGRNEESEILSSKR